MIDREREGERERQRHGHWEKQAPCQEPDVGLDPGTPGSCSGLKADALPLSHPGVPAQVVKLLNCHSRLQICALSRVPCFLHGT